MSISISVFSWNQSITSAQLLQVLSAAKVLINYSNPLIMTLARYILSMIGRRERAHKSEVKSRDCKKDFGKTQPAPEMAYIASSNEQWLYEPAHEWGSESIPHYEKQDHERVGGSGFR